MRKIEGNCQLLPFSVLDYLLQQEQHVHCLSLKATPTVDETVVSASCSTLQKSTTSAQLDISAAH
jgi:hypothetical protein